MNFGLAREIYGMQPWYVDQQTLPAMVAMLRNLQQGGTIETPETKNNTPYLLKHGEDQRIIYSPRQLDNKDKFKGVGIISLDGPITKYGGMSSYGTLQLASIMLHMAADERIVSLIILADSGGGSTSAVEIMVDAIREVRNTKPVHALITKGGLACSACYGIISTCDTIHSESKMNIVGSIGTMVQFEGKKANSESPDGTKHIRLYATKSTKKNIDYEEALNNDNYELMVSNLLDPINEDFIRMVRKNRPSLKGTKFSDGHHTYAKDAIGTFIDGIKSFTQILDIAYKGNQVTGGSKSNNVSLKSNTMTVEELRQSHPETYNSIFNAGVAAEKDRTGSWLAHLGTNQEKVLNGIRGGNQISATEREELIVEGNSKRELSNLQKDSAQALRTTEAREGKGEGEAENQEELDSFYAGIDAKLKTV